MIDDQTHFEGCWQDPRKHPNCALARIIQLEAENEDQKRVIDLFAEQDGLVIPEIRRQVLVEVRCWMADCAEIGDLDERVMDEMGRLGPPDGWIKCSDRLPEEGACCLFLIPTSLPFVCAGFVEETHPDAPIYDQYGDSVGYELEAVSHWMPLPQPPKEPSHD